MNYNIIYGPIENDMMQFSIKLSQCKNCNNLMVPFWEDVPFFSWRELEQKAGIKKESYSVSGLCDSCLDKGGYIKSCDLCGNLHVFPNEFSFKLVRYAKYPDDDTRYDYICSDCSDFRPKNVIEEMVHVDEIEDIRKVETE